MQNRFPFLLSPVPALLLLGLASSCSSEAGDAPASRLGIPSSGFAGASATGEPPLGQDKPVQPPTLSPRDTDDDPDADADGACQADTYVGKRVPVDMYFLIDSSGSMILPVAGGTRWQVVSQALISFLSTRRDAESAVGVGYFPNFGPAPCAAGDPGCFCAPGSNQCFSNVGGGCAPADYRPAVKLELPANAGPAVDDISTHLLSGGTPTRPAFEGTLQYLKGWAASQPDRKTVLVLATDGEPAGCDRNSPQDIAALAAEAWSGPSGIRTFVIGVGGSLATLDVVAQAGGTDRVLQVDGAADVGQQFTEALEKIQNEAAVACDFAIPEASAGGGAVDPQKVNVRFQPSGISSSVLVSQTPGSDPKACGPEGGWYYDDPAAPKQIKLCEATCSALQGASIQVEFGCDTIVQPPR
jgi:hypothetical protein